ncbi:MAG: dihydroorotate dehydrogenase electron transfer subunit [Nitrosopumilus sp.]|nr:dihydroorotate dehydrogenase electron transfer subunit [Nitrosopumilus sp.]
MVTIDDIIEETPTVKTFIFRDKSSYFALPGQFLMVWIPRCEELPLSIMISEEKDYAAITIRKHGYGSTSLFNMKKGDKLGIRGPYGNSFIIKENYENIILIGGGTGLVPIVRFLNTLKYKNIKILIIIGSKSKTEIFFVDIIKKLLEKNKRYKILISTEDGSFGTKGYPIDILEEVLLKSNDNFDMVYTCGPELMMKKIFDIVVEKRIPLQASLERYMKCGIGVCSSCCINDKLVCYDGTIFNNEQIQNLSEFGFSYRDKSGILHKYDLN